MPGAAWSEAVTDADWVAARLAPFEAHRVTSVVPSGFTGYARVLHPAEDPDHGERLVRWREVAAWSSTELGSGTQFHTIALPSSQPEGPAPWSGQGPHQGSLYPGDAVVLAGILRRFTSVPERCSFLLWDGYGFTGPKRGDRSSDGLAAPMPRSLRRGLRTHLPERDYLCYTGPVEAISAPAVLVGDGQCANLCWPADRSWCVASEVDLAWTYIAGSIELVEALCADGRIEALSASRGDPLTRVEPWVAAWVDRAVTSLLTTGEATVLTCRGELLAHLERPDSRRPGALRTCSRSESGVDSGGTAVPRVADDEDLRQRLDFHLTIAVIGLVGG